MKAGNLVGIGLGLCAFAVNLVLAQYSYCGTPAAGCPTVAPTAPSFSVACTTANVICPISSSSYLLCSTNQWLQVSCLSGTTFDCTSKACTAGGSGSGSGPYSYCGAANTNCPTLTMDDPTFSPACNTTNVICPINKASYLQCLGNQWVQVSCLTGNTFDCPSKTCAVGGSGGGSGGGGSGGGGNYTNPCDGKPAGYKYPYTGYDNLYFVCTNGYPILYQCINNQVFNPTTSSCQTSTGSGAGSVTCPGGVTTLLPANNGNCANYVSCVNGVGALKQCPSGLYFSPTMSACTINKPSSC